MKRMRFTATAAVWMFGMAFSPVQAHDTPEEAANKKLVLDYYDEQYKATAEKIDMEKLEQINKKYRDPGYIQHSVMGGPPGGARPGGGGAPPAGATGGMPAGGPPAFGPPPNATGGMPPAKLLAIAADGDKVIQVTSRSMPDGANPGKQRETIIFNMFRVKNGKLIEHWDAFGTPAN